MQILVDMDGVLADFEAGFLARWRALHPELPYIPLDERQDFYLEKDYPKEHRPRVFAIFTSPGFFRELPLVPGGKAAIEAMRDLGHDVSICTSPLKAYKNCVLEKYEWVEEHLGFGWTGRIILLKDKTLVRGDVLIDDRPRIIGAMTPQWEHVLYDQPYNRRENDKRRLTWENWQSVLLP